jgi:hypothetical protein
MRKNHVAGERAEAERNQTRHTKDRKTLSSPPLRHQIRRICEQRRVPHRPGRAIDQPHGIYARAESGNREIQSDRDDKERDTTQDHYASSAGIHDRSNERPHQDGAYRLHGHDATDLPFAGSNLLQEARKVHEQRA